MANKRKELNISERDLWYLTGLIATDGCLSSDGRHIDITSSDHEFLTSIRNRFGFINRVTSKGNGMNQMYYHIQLSNRFLYEFLLSIGLTPRKSLTIREINVSEENFCDFLRGVVDGDGGIQKWINNKNRKEQWNLRIASGSIKFLEWLRQKITENIGVSGKIYSQGKNQFRLKYGKMAGRVIAEKCYYVNCFGLQRKIKLAQACVEAYKGWRKSKTIICCN